MRSKWGLVGAFALGVSVALLYTQIGKHAPVIKKKAPSNQLLERVASLRVYRWAYIWRPKVIHIGPMAQEFHEIFGVGSSSRTINLVDAFGILLASVQALYAQVRDLQMLIQANGEENRDN